MNHVKYVPARCADAQNRGPQSQPKQESPIKRTSITLGDPVYAAGQEIAAKRGFGQSFSAYIAWLIQRDAEGGVTREKPPRYETREPKSRQPAKKRPPAKASRSR